MLPCLAASGSSLRRRPNWLAAGRPSSRQLAAATASAAVHGRRAGAACRSRAGQAAHRSLAPPNRAAERIAETRPCEASGVALSAARETGTNSMPRPSPIGMSAKAVPMPCSETPGIARIAVPTPALRKPSTRGIALAVPIGEDPRQRSGDAHQQRDDHEHRARPKRRVVHRLLQVLLSKAVERPDHHRERQAGDQRGSRGGRVEHAATTLLGPPRARVSERQPTISPRLAASASGTSAHQAARASRRRPTRTPPSSGPTRFAVPALAPQIPRALPRRSGGKPRLHPPSAAGLTRPTPIPCSTRVRHREG